MANIPGMLNSLPGWDEPIQMTFGGPEGRLVTDDYGIEFKIEGSVRLAAVAVVKYALVGAHSYRGISFSGLEFDFGDGIRVKPRRQNEDRQEVFDLIKEIEKILEMKVFL